MRRKWTSLILFGLITIQFFGCVREQQRIFQAVAEKTHTAVTPERIQVEEVQAWYGPRHNAVNERLKQGNTDVLFIGNSITHDWEGDGKRYWNQYYAHRNAVNMGFSWDRTQHALWRLDHSDFSNISPKLAIVHIGTNNSNGNDNSAREIADGIIAICHKLRTLFPKMKILLLAIFPREHSPSAQRTKNAEASLLASRIADGRMIHYLDLSGAFLDKDGMLSADIMPDYLHPNEEGYRIWAEAMEPKVAELLSK